MAHYDVTRRNCITLELKKCFHCNARHKSLGLEDKTTMKSDINELKVAQMLIFGSKWLKWLICDVIMTTPVPMMYFWNVKKAFIMLLHIVTWV